VHLPIVPTATSPASDPLPTSETLLEKLRHRDDQASWRRFDNLYATLLHRYACRAGLDPTEAEDAVQETMVEVVEKMPGFRYEPALCSFKSWLQLTVRRRVADQFRRRKYRLNGEEVSRTQPLDDALVATLVEEDSDLDRLWDEEWRSHLLDAAAQQIKDTVKAEHYQVFHLHVLRCIPAREVALRCGVTLMTVYWARLRVGKRVRAALREIEQRGLV
jgi:RNA polymerase sigma factor (sigma-70 family)